MDLQVWAVALDKYGVAGVRQDQVSIRQWSLEQQGPREQKKTVGVGVGGASKSISTDLITALRRMRNHMLVTEAQQRPWPPGGERKQTWDRAG